MLIPVLRKQLAAGIAEETGRDITQLEARRDRFLVDLLAMKAATDDG